MQITNSLETLTKDNLFKYVAPIDIFSKYMDKPIFNKAFSSPFRSDNRPSFLINSKKAIFIDFGTGERGDCITFVKKLFNVNFNDALVLIAKDFSLDNKFVISSSVEEINRAKKAKIQNVKGGRQLSGIFNLKIKKRTFNKNDIDYWESYGISKSTLDIIGVVSISHFFLNNVPFKAEEYAYAYIENKDNTITYKVYQPFSINRKWINNNNYTVWEMWKCLPSAGSKVIITSSRKDAASIYENSKIPATSLQSETTIPRKRVISELERRFEKVYLFYDNDTGIRNWGQENALKLINLFPNLINIKIPDIYGCKDYSDLVYKYGRVDSINILNTLL